MIRKLVLSLGFALGTVAAIAVAQEIGSTPIQLPLSPPPRPWNVEPDPMPEFTGTVLAQPMPLGPEWTRDARFTSAAVAKMATLNEDQAKNFAVQRWDLKKKRKISLNPVAKESQLLDYRSDGAVYATVEDRGNGDVIVWSCGEREDKEIARIKSEPRQSRGDHGGAFVGKNLLLLCAQGKLTAYTLPRGDVAYELDGYRDLPAFSWGRKYFLGRTTDPRLQTPALFNAADGTPAGKLEPPHGAPALFAYENASGAGLKLMQAAFHPNGKLLAALTESDDVLLWNLETGKLVKTFPHVGNWRQLRWGGAKHLLLGEKMVFDAEYGQIVWQYSFPYLVKDSPDGKIWCFENGLVGNKQTYHVLSFYAPSGNVIAAVEKSFKNAAPLVPSGGTVKLELKIENENEKAEITRLRARMQEAVAAALQKRKLAPSDDASDNLTILVNARRNQPDFVFRDGGKEWFVPQLYFQIIVKYNLSRGGLGGNYLRETTFDLPKTDYKFDPAAADPVDELLRQYEARIVMKLNSMLEDDLFTEKGGVQRPGESRMDLDGEEIRK